MESAVAVLDTQTWLWCHHQSEKGTSFIELVLAVRDSHIVHDHQRICTHTSSSLCPLSPCWRRVTLELSEVSMKGKIKGTSSLCGEHFQFRIYLLGKHRAQESAQMSCFSVQAEPIAPSMLLCHFLGRSPMWNWFQDPQKKHPNPRCSSPLYRPMRHLHIALHTYVLHLLWVTHS